MKPVAVFAGLIRLRSSPFPKLQGTEYVLNVTATDDNASGGPHSLTSTAQVIVKIDDVNNNQSFRRYRYMRLGSLHWVVHVSDCCYCK